MAEQRISSSSAAASGQFRSGCLRHRRWNRWNKDDVLSFWIEDQQPIYLKPGNTWFEVVNLPDATDIQQEITVK